MNEDKLPKLKMPVYSANTEIYSKRMDKPVNLAAAMNVGNIDDFSNVSKEMFDDWNILLKMNEIPGAYHHILTYEKKQQLIRYVTEWRKIHFNQI